MAIVVRFSTRIFDVGKERANEINPIHGESLLTWLAQRAHGTVEVSPPAAEDWGWYSDVHWHGRAYLLGSSASDEEAADGSREWTLQIDKHRSFGERLMGKQKMTPDDACAMYFIGLLRAEPAFVGVTME